MKYNIYYCYALVESHQHSILIYFDLLWSIFGLFQSICSTSIHSVWSNLVQFNPFGPLQSIQWCFGIEICVERGVVLLSHINIAFWSTLVYFRSILVYLFHFNPFYLVQFGPIQSIWSTSVSFGPLQSIRWCFGIEICVERGVVLLKVMSHSQCNFSKFLIKLHFSYIIKTL